MTASHNIRASVHGATSPISYPRRRPQDSTAISAKYYMDRYRDGFEKTQCMIADQHTLRGRGGKISLGECEIGSGSCCRKQLLANPQFSFLNNIDLFSVLDSAGTASFRMADISKSNPGIGKKGGLELDTGSGGGVAVITRPRVDKKTERKSKTEREPSWRVLLHNDDVHTFDYVTGAIVKVVRTVSRKKAHRITMQAHASGVATVTTTWKALAEDYCKGLQMHGLTSSIAPDSSFKA